VAQADEVDAILAEPQQPPIGGELGVEDRLQGILPGPFPFSEPPLPSPWGSVTPSSLQGPRRQEASARRPGVLLLQPPGWHEWTRRIAPPGSSNPEGACLRGGGGRTVMAPCCLASGQTSRTALTRSCMEGLAEPKNIMVLSM
jgi:hypothetical protein